MVIASQPTEKVTFFMLMTKVLQVTQRATNEPQECLKGRAENISGDKREQSDKNLLHDAQLCCWWKKKKNYCVTGSRKDMKEKVKVKVKVLEAGFCFPTNTYFADS